MWVASWPGNGLSVDRGDEPFDTEEDAMDRAAEVVAAHPGQAVTVWELLDEVEEAG